MNLSQLSLMQVRFPTQLNLIVWITELYAKSIRQAVWWLNGQNK